MGCLVLVFLSHQLLEQSVLSGGTPQTILLQGKLVGASDVGDDGPHLLQAHGPPRRMNWNRAVGDGLEDVLGNRAGQVDGRPLGGRGALRMVHRVDFQDGRAARVHAADPFNTER